MRAGADEGVIKNTVKKPTDTSPALALTTERTETLRFDAALQMYRRGSSAARAYYLRLSEH